MEKLHQLCLVHFCVQIFKLLGIRTKSGIKDPFWVLKVTYQVVLGFENESG